jgi:hypothetical protein
VADCLQAEPVGTYLPSPACADAKTLVWQMFAILVEASASRGIVSDVSHAVRHLVQSFCHGIVLPPRLLQYLTCQAGSAKLSAINICWHVGQFEVLLRKHPGLELFWMVLRRNRCVVASETSCMAAWGKGGRQAVRVWAGMHGKAGGAAGVVSICCIIERVSNSWGKLSA